MVHPQGYLAVDDTRRTLGKIRRSERHLTEAFGQLQIYKASDNGRSLEGFGKIDRRGRALRRRKDEGRAGAEGSPPRGDRGRRQTGEEGGDRSFLPEQDRDDQQLEHTGGQEDGESMGNEGGQTGTGRGNAVIVYSEVVV